MHRGYAGEVVTQRQLRNIAKHTELDISATNRLMAASRQKL